MYLELIMLAAGLAIYLAPTSLWSRSSFMHSIGLAAVLLAATSLLGIHGLPAYLIVIAAAFADIAFWRPPLVVKGHRAT